MTAPLGRGSPRWGRSIAFICIGHPLQRTDMSQALGIRKIGGRRRHFVNQSRLQLHTDVFFIGGPIRLLSLAANPRLWSHCDIWPHLIIQ
jgi:hypothetical protein